VVTEWVDKQIQIAYAEEFERPDINQMMNVALSLVSRYGITFDNSCRIFVDGANPSFIHSLNYQLGENADYEQEIDYYKKSFREIYNFFGEKHVCLFQFILLRNANECWHMLRKY
jgi:hypothetical protein